MVTDGDDCSALSDVSEEPDSATLADASEFGTGVKEVEKQCQDKLAMPKKGMLKKRHDLTMQAIDCQKREAMKANALGSDDESGFSDVSSNPVGNPDVEADRQDPSGSIKACPGDEPIEKPAAADGKAFDLLGHGEGSKPSNDPSQCRRRSFNYQSFSHACATLADNIGAVGGLRKDASETKFSDTESGFGEEHEDGTPFEHVAARNCEGQSRRRSLDYQSCANMVASRMASMDAVDGPKKDAREIRFSDTESDFGDSDEDDRPLEHVPAGTCKGDSRRRSLDYQSIAARAANIDAANGDVPKPDMNEIAFSDNDSDKEDSNKDTKNSENYSVRAARCKDREGNPTLLTASNVTVKTQTRQSSSRKNVSQGVQNPEALESEPGK